MADEIERFFLTNHKRLSTLSKKFANYIVPIELDRIKFFISQFDYEHLDIVLKLLENVDYYAGDRRLALLHQLGGMILELTNKDLNNVLFCPMQRYPGDSSDQYYRMLYRHLKGRVTNCPKYNDKFIHLSDLSRYEDKKMTIFFIDDFIGSGQSVIEQWGTLQTYENDNHEYFYAVLVAYDQAVAEIRKETFEHFEIISARNLADREKIFHEENSTFTKDEKSILKAYCEKISHNPKHAYGHLNTQSLVVFQDNIPNNTIPILHKDHNNWVPLFQRYF